MKSDSAAAAATFAFAEVRRTRRGRAAADWSPSLPPRGVLCAPSGEGSGNEDGDDDDDDDDDEGVDDKGNAGGVSWSSTLAAGVAPVVATGTCGAVRLLDEAERRSTRWACRPHRDARALLLIRVRIKSCWWWWCCCSSCRSCTRQAAAVNICQVATGR